MQKLLLSVCLLVSVMYVSGQRTATKRSSSKSSDHNNAVKLGVNTFFDTDEFPFNVAWETKVGTNQSIQIGLLPRVRTFNDDKLNGVGVNIAYRKYISKNKTGISGLFVSPVFKFGYLKDDTNFYTYGYTGNPPVYQSVYRTNEATTKQYSIGALFGHKWAYRSGFTFEASGGLGFYYTRRSYAYDNNPYPPDPMRQSGILPQLQLSFGYAF